MFSARELTIEHLLRGKPKRFPLKVPLYICR
ncbi:hypothetical protein HRbin11_01651 [bacterium HR11]|nr:hypothetical protein HRbin11_01651 [bacterium HR11]